MVISNRHRPKKTVEIYQSAIIDRVVQVRAAAFVEIHDDLEPVQQNVLLDRLEDFRSRYWLFCFALWRSVSSGRCLGEDGCDTHW